MKCLYCIMPILMYTLNFELYDTFHVQCKLINIFVTGSVASFLYTLCKEIKRKMFLSI